MSQITATIFLVLVIALIAKMVWDVQMAKINRFFKEIERFQVLAGIKPHNKEKGEDALLKAMLPGVDIEGIEELAERFQKLADIKNTK